MMRKLIDNGYVVQRKGISDYYGIEGDNWYLNYCSENSYFENFYEDNIDKSWNDARYVDCCTNEAYLKNYIEESQKLGIEFNVLLCSTCKEFPYLEELRLGNERKVLGYDCAYAGGSYYSCVLNDIISGRINAFCNITLNDNGLFNCYEDAEMFLKYRNRIKCENVNDIFEDGDFIIYKITKIIF